VFLNNFSQAVITIEHKLSIFKGNF